MGRAGGFSRSGGVVSHQVQLISEALGLFGSLDPCLLVRSPSCSQCKVVSLRTGTCMADGYPREDGGDSSSDERKDGRDRLEEAGAGLTSGEPQVPFGKVVRPPLLGQLCLSYAMILGGLGTPVAFCWGLVGRKHI